MKGLLPRDLPAGATCPRKAPSTPALPPEKGQFVTMFLASPRGWQDDIGTGWRNFIVLRVGRKWITLFHAPRLKSFEISFKEWEELRPRVYFPGAESLVYLSTALPFKVKQFEEHCFKHRASCTEQALEIVNKQLARIT